MAGRKKKKVTAKQKQERATAKAEKFKELASKRVNAAIGRIRLLRNLANKNSYTYTQEQVDKLLGALQDEVDAIQEAFASPSKSESTGFSFEDEA